VHGLLRCTWGTVGRLVSKGLDLWEEDDNGVAARDYLPLVPRAAASSASYWATAPSQRMPFNPFLSALATWRRRSSGTSRETGDESSEVEMLDDPSSHPSSSRQAERVEGLPLAECWRLMWRVLQVDFLHQAAASSPQTTLESRRRRRSSGARRKEEEAKVTYGASVMAAAFGVGDVR
jgi:hypothetical protein